MYSIKAESFFDRFGTLLFDVTFKEEGGEIVEKRIAAETFAQLLISNLVHMESLVEVPRLSDVFYRAKVSPTHKDSFEALLVFKAKKRGFSYLGELFFMPFPALIMKIKYVEGIRQVASMYALDTDEPDEDSNLYCYPFGNVDPDDGDICFGNIKMDIKDVSDAPRVFDYFIEGHTNNDLYRNQNTKGLKQEPLIKEVKDLEKYPSSLLLGNGLKVGDLWS